LLVLRPLFQVPQWSNQPNCGAIILLCDGVRVMRAASSYGLSDDRWNNYQNGTSLLPPVWLINVNDAGLGARQ
jgi:hypothetical protein